MAAIGEIVGTPQLLQALARELAFPGYFGHNFDSLLDCLRDLAWLPEREAVIYHRRVPLLVRRNMRTYVSILEMALREWKESGDERRLSVTFPTDSEQFVRELLIEWNETSEIWRPERD